MHLIYCDDPPASSDGGLSSVLGAIFCPSLPSVSLRAIVGRGAAKGKAVGLNLWSVRGVRFNPLLRLPFLLIDALIINIQLGRSDLRQASSMCIWVGNDWTSLARGIIVARALRIERPDVYVVDNPFGQHEPVTSIADAVGQYIVRHLCRRAGSLFSISTNLAAELSAKVEGTWKPLPLPYRLDEHVAKFLSLPRQEDVYEKKSNTRHIVFVGGMALSALDPLERISKAISDYNEKNELKSHFHLNIFSNSSSELIEAFAGTANTRNVTIRRSISDVDLRSIMPSDSIFVAPYADIPRCENIVLNSFPSKILKALWFGFPVGLVVPLYAGVRESHGEWVPCFEIGDVEADLDEFFTQIQNSQPWQCVPLLYNHSLAHYFQVLAER